MTYVRADTGGRPDGAPGGEATLSTDSALGAETAPGPLPYPDTAPGPLPYREANAAHAAHDARGTHDMRGTHDTQGTRGPRGEHGRRGTPGASATRDAPATRDASATPGAHPAPAPPDEQGPGAHPAPASPPPPPPPVVTTDGLPGWLDPVVDAMRVVRGEQLSQFLPPEDGAGRQSAVLILFGHGPQGPELLLTERATSLRSHAGQPSFPGGSLDPQDGDPATTGPLRAALREAEEETGLDPAGVRLFGVLPRLYIPVSGFVVSPVLGWWHEPSPVRAVDPGETARVFTVPVTELTDPAHRVTAVHPRGFEGPAFLVRSALVWGFTAGVIDRILHFAGWERPWDRGKRVSLDWRS